MIYQNKILDNVNHKFGMGGKVVLIYYELIMVNCMHMHTQTHIQLAEKTQGIRLQQTKESKSINIA